MRAAFRGKGRRKWIAGSGVALLVAAAVAAVFFRSTATTPRPVAKVDAGRLLKRAERAIDRGDAGAAAATLEEILAANPADGMALLYRGQLARDRGDRQAALADWRKVGDRPANVAGTARYLEGLVLLEQGRAQEAERLFLKSAELNPRYVQPLDRLRELYVVQARRDDVRRVIERVASIRPWTLDELVFRIVPPERATTPDSGAKLMESYLAAEPDDLPSALALAVYRIEGERHAEAVDLLRRLREQRPGDPRAAALLGEALLRLGDAGAAREVLARVPTVDGSPAVAWRSHGHLAAADGDWSRAAECLGRAVEAEPEDSASLYRLGVVTQRLGRVDEARRLLERSAVMDRMQREALRLVWGDRNAPELRLPIVVEVGRSLAGSGYVAEAGRWFEQALAIRPDDPAAVAGMRDAAARVAADPALVSGPDPFGPRAASAEPPPLVAEVPGAAGRVPEPAADPSAPIALRDVAPEAGLEYVYFNGNTGFKHLVESMGGGVGVIDCDSDGRPDLYFPQGCELPYDPAKNTHLDSLRRNRGDGTFEDVTARAGIVENRYGQGVAVGDYDGDGFGDVAVANYGRNTLYRSNGDGTFADVTAAAGLAGAEEMSSSLAFADLDLDGHADLYVTNYVTELKVCRDPDGTYHSCAPTNFEAREDRLYRSNADGTFEDVTAAAGVTAPDGKGLGVLVADFDDDAKPDVFVANDTTPNFLFRNAGGAGAMRFAEDGLAAGVALSGEGRAQAGMGIASADFDGDGRADLHVTNFYQETNSLYLNLGGGMFFDAVRDAGLAEPSFAMLGFGTQAADFDLDGDPDLFVANGHIDDFSFRGEPWKMPAQLYVNRGGARFADDSRRAGPYFSEPHLGRGVARLDYDGDGRPDLAVVHQDAPVGLLRNETAGGRGLVLRLRGTAANRDAVGATAFVTGGGRTQRLDVTGGDGFFSSNDKALFVGLGEATAVDAVEIRWPGGRVDRWEGLAADVTLLCVEGRPPLPLLQGHGS